MIYDYTAKPLRWQLNTGFPELWSGRGIIGEYFVTLTDAGYRVSHARYDISTLVFETADEAKARCQRHYAETILAELEYVC